MTTFTSEPKPIHTLPVDETGSLSVEANALVAWFHGRGPLVVAFSGGVDSSVVLAAALRCREIQVTAVTAVSPSVASWQIDLAKSIAAHLGADHHLIPTHEVDSPEYAANDKSRCFYCKQTLYRALDQLAAQLAPESVTIVSGTNADDLGDYRPGIAAGDQAGVLKPLAEQGLGKDQVRAIASEFGLPNAMLPASPCLASRIAYGVQVTPQRLAQVEQAESYLRSLGLENVRVRLHEGDLARIEVLSEHIAMLAVESTRSALTARLIEIGFRFVTLDLQGFSSGSLNRQLVSLGRPQILGCPQIIEP